MSAFAISKLGKSSQEFVSTMTRNAKSRSLQASLALARVLSNGLGLPSAPVENVHQYYQMQCRIAVEGKLGIINELMVVDFKLVLDLVEKMFRLRYSMAHPPATVYVFKAETVVEDFFGISREFDQATLEAIKLAPGELTSYVNEFTTMVRELSA